MKTGFVCRPVRLKFVGDPLEIPAFYFQKCKDLQISDKERRGVLSEGSIKSVVTATHEEAEKLLRKHVGDALRSCAWWNGSKIKPSDFRFEIYFSEVKGGEFWPSLSASRLGEYIPE